jgi:hypothetical protein
VPKGKLIRHLRHRLLLPTTPTRMHTIRIFILTGITPHLDLGMGMAMATGGARGSMGTMGGDFAKI